jgi:predicted lysophospholipase L1 biosynthesis ABC-type transport system permease subunit
MKSTFILGYWVLTVLLQAVLLALKLGTGDIGVLWNVFSALAAVYFIALRLLHKKNKLVYQSIIAGFIGLNGINLAIAELVRKSWFTMTLSIVMVVISFTVVYLVHKESDEMLSNRNENKA